MKNTSVSKQVTSHEVIIDFDDLIAFLNCPRGAKITLETPSGPAWSASTHNVSPITKIVARWDVTIPA